MLYGAFTCFLRKMAGHLGRFSELSTRTFCSSRASCRPGGGHLTSTDRASLQRLSGVNELPDDHPHDHIAAPAAALRPPAAGSRPQHPGRDHRHRSRGSSINGPWLAPHGTEGRGDHRRGEREDIGTPARSSGAAATHEEAQGTTAARPRPASKLGIHLDARASARRTRQDQDPASRGSRPQVCVVAGTPAVPAIVPESLACLATAAGLMCA